MIESESNNQGDTFRCRLFLCFPNIFTTLHLLSKTYVRGTNYTYDVITKDKENNQLSAYSGEFTTYSSTPSDLENLDTQSPISTCQKLLRNGQLIILRDGVEYNAMGQEIQ